MVLMKEFVADHITPTKSGALPSGTVDEATVDPLAAAGSVFYR